MLFANETLYDGDIEKALDVLSGLNIAPIRSQKLRSSQQRLLAQAQIRVEDYDGAIASLTNVIDFPRSDRMSALINRCFAYLRINLVLDAQRDCAAAKGAIKSAEIRGKPVSDHRKISFAMVEAEILLRSGRTGAALDTLTAAIGIAQQARTLDRHWGLSLFKAQVLTVLGREDEALSIIDRITPKVPPSEKHQILAERAAVFLRKGNIETALYNWSAASLASPKNAEEYLFKSCVSLIQAAKYERARAPCGELVQLDEDNSVFADAYAVSVLESQGVMAAAPEVLRALELRPRSELLMRMTNEIRNSASNYLKSTNLPPFLWGQNDPAD
ncbi:hypothetical protein [uncultured Tateyamaria sp.]|uniref:hypothetical protein n=1 Tax=uncultured Tateyamaria sp. TaxID=455651 RepID=UPI00262CB838|nr:hypothetical protein [uncultured Tateyamaria sp.]